MTEQQLNTLLALFAGQQAAAVHLAKLIGHVTDATHESIAASFEETAAAVPPDAPNREVIQMCIRQVAAGIRSSEAGPQFEALMKRLLH